MIVLYCVSGAAEPQRFVCGVRGCPFNGKDFHGLKVHLYRGIVLWPTLSRCAASPPCSSTTPADAVEVARRIVALTTASAASWSCDHAAALRKLESTANDFLVALAGSSHGTCPFGPGLRQVAVSRLGGSGSGSR